VPGQQQRHHLIPDLRLGEVRVRSQQLKHWSGGRPIGPAPAYQILDDVVELGLG
jgi:hypothetical protein